jgi:hypothetical protein
MTTVSLTPAGYYTWQVRIPENLTVQIFSLFIKIWNLESRAAGAMSLIGEPSLRGHRWFTTGVEEDVRSGK